MNDTQALTPIPANDPVATALSGWLHAHGKRWDEEKECYTYTRTAKAYEQTMEAFRKMLHEAGLEVGSDPTSIALVAQVFAYGPAKGKEAKKTTVNHRLACLSSFYRYAKKRKLYQGDNPLDVLDREKVQEYAHATALEEETVKEALRKIDQRTPKGKRDYALLSVLLQTGRRAQEVATLAWGAVTLSGGQVTLTFEHAKGDEVMLDELPQAVTNVLLRWLHTYYGDDLAALPPDTPLWVSLAHDGSYGKPLGYQSINTVCQKYLETSKVHATRHTAAHAMEEVGLSVSEIQSRLGHKSLATTGRYLASLRRAKNRKADELAAYYGIE